MDNQPNSQPAAIRFGLSDESDPEQLSELERFAEIGRLSAGLLHEIANPLTAAILWLEQSNQKSPPIRQACHSIRLLQRYVEAARQQLRHESQCRNFSVQPELEQVRQLLTPLARRRGVQLRFASGHGYRLYGDPVKFQHIIANLLRNAIDSYEDCPPGRRYRPVRLGLRSRHGELLISVTDQGCGIARDQLPQLFRPFYTTKKHTGRGLGIGLFGVKRSLETDFHGTIQVKSTERRGTRFIIKLDLAADH